MKVNLGDNVRFLNAEGGGRVTRIEGRKIYVEDNDGFEIPVMDNDVVVVNETDERRQGRADYAEHTAKQQKKKKLPQGDGASWRERLKADEEDEEDYEEPVRPLRPNTGNGKDEAKKPEEPKYEYQADATDDADPHFYLALLRADGGNSGALDLYAVNDSNYFASFVLMTVDSKSLATTTGLMTVEPNTKVKLDTLNPMQVDGQTWQVQLLMYKRIRSYKPQPVYNTEIKPRGTKLLKDGSFLPNDFFDERALLLPVIKDEFATKIEQLTAKDMKSAKEGRAPEPRKVSKPSNAKGLLEVDLHIEQLLESTRGLDNKDMLEVQMNHVRSVMKENASQHGLRIVFIHGVGAGVLKNEIRKFLERNYPKCAFQDASFREYGFGATMVTL